MQNLLDVDPNISLKFMARIHSDIKPSLKYQEYEKSLPPTPYRGKLLKK